MNVFAIQKHLCDFLTSVTGCQNLTADSDLMNAGVTDSLTMMDLLVFNQFGIRRE